MWVHPSPHPWIMAEVYRLGGRGESVGQSVRGVDSWMVYSSRPDSQPHGLTLLFCHSSLPRYQLPALCKPSNLLPCATDCTVFLVQTQNCHHLQYYFDEMSQHQLNCELVEMCSVRGSVFMYYCSRWFPGFAYRQLEMEQIIVEIHSCCLVKIQNRYTVGAQRHKD